jgi:HrpA-like RNA helicase
MLLVDTMKKIKTKTKLVLMSATLDPQILQNYFKSISLDIPVIKVPGRTFPVEKYFNTDGNYIATIAKLYN